MLDKATWQQTQAEYLQSDAPMEYRYATFHETMVRDAVARRKPVPANVLADYPDLVK